MRNMSAFKFGMVTSLLFQKDLISDASIERRSRLGHWGNSCRPYSYEYEGSQVYKN